MPYGEKTTENFEMLANIVTGQGAVIARQAQRIQSLENDAAAIRRATSSPYGETTTENFEMLANIVTDQQEEIKQQAQHIQSLENDLATTQATLSTSTFERDYFQQRTDILLGKFKAFLAKSNPTHDEGASEIAAVMEQTMDAPKALERSSHLSQAGPSGESIPGAAERLSMAEIIGDISSSDDNSLDAGSPATRSETDPDGQSEPGLGLAETTAGSPSSDPLKFQPTNFDSLLEKADQLGIPRRYVALGYPICTQTKWPETIHSYTDLGDPREFKPQQEEQILRQIAKYCKNDIKQIKKMWLQAAFLETFIDEFKYWLPYDHDKFQAKLAGVKEVSEGGIPGPDLYTKVDQRLMTRWQDDQKKDDRNAAFTPGIWQPAEWLDTLAKAHRDPSPSKAMQLAGLWADCSFLIAGDKLTQKSRQRYQDNKNCFNWREFDPSTPVAAKKVRKKKSGSSMPPPKKSRTR